MSRYTGLAPLYGCAFKLFSASCLWTPARSVGNRDTRIHNTGNATPRRVSCATGLVSIRFRRHYHGVSLPVGTEMFTFPQVPPPDGGAGLHDLPAVLHSETPASKAMRWRFLDYRILKRSPSVLVSAGGAFTIMPRKVAI